MFRAAAILGLLALLTSQISAQTACTSASSGTHGGTLRVLSQKLIGQEVMYANVQMPQNACFPNERVVGVDLDVCDGDIKPLVYFSDLVTANVYRKGNLLTSATVDMTVWCVYGYASAALEAPTA